MKSYRKLQVLMFYRLGKKMRKPYGGGGHHKPKLVLKKPALEQSY